MKKPVSSRWRRFVHVQADLCIIFFAMYLVRESTFGASLKVAMIVLLMFEIGARFLREMSPT